MVTEQHRSPGADEGVSAYGGAGAREATGPSRPTARGRAVITGGAVQRFLATPDQVGAARKFVAQELGEDHPCADDAVVSLSEVATNAVAHSYSARAGRDGDVGAFTVTLTYGEAWARVEVRDGGGPTRPYAHAQEPKALDACEELMYCPCGGHIKTVKITPSDPNYASNLVGELRRSTCWKEQRWPPST